jgi:hypothetical protein
MQTRVHSNGLTLAELLVSTVVVAVLAVVFTSIGCGCGGSPIKGQETQTLNNARQLYIAGFSMAADYGTTGEEDLGWPGDLADRKRNPITTVSAYIDRLVARDYLKKADMAKVLQAPDVPKWDTAKPFMAEYCPFKVYRVEETDSPNVLFCATRNFTYNKGLDEKKVPYGAKGFVLFRKGGDGSVFTNKKQATSNLSSLGLLPSRKDFQTKNVETADDYLMQR